MTIPARSKRKLRRGTKPRALTPAYLTDCPHPEKFGYRTKGAAKRELKRRRRMKNLDDLHPYRCRCGLFHVGHRVPLSVRKRREEKTP